MQPVERGVLQGDQASEGVTDDGQGAVPIFGADLACELGEPLLNLLGGDEHAHGVY